VIRLRLGSAFVNQTPLAWEQNSAHIRAALEEARSRGIGVLCLPELAVSGYGCEDAFLAPWAQRRALDEALSLLPQTKGLFTALGLPLTVEGALYNALLVAADGQLLGVVLKQHLARTGLHYEPRWFQPWAAGRTTRMKLAGREARVGDLLFKLGEACVGFEVCEDAWAGAARPAPQLAARGANLLLCPAASHFAFGKTRVRRELGVEAARRHGLGYAYANLMGNESGRVIFDGGAYVLDPQGRLVGEGSRFSYRPYGIVDAVLELRARPLEADPGLVEVGFRPAEPSAAPSASLTQAQAFEDQPHEEFTRAVALGLFDYLRKSKAQGYALSLSGGADSAACAVLLRSMADFGSRELGWKPFAQALAQVPGLTDCGGVAAAMPLLLRTLYQASAHSGPVTRRAAQAVAQAVGARHDVVEIQSLVDSYKAMAERVLGRPLRWQEDDLALQNLQARVRSPGVWMLANAENRLLMATNNRSESAAGYTTMDGDTSGGLAPIAGVGKHFLRGWLRWMERTGPQGIGPLPALLAVNEQEPTAELRPPEDGQTDEGDLMPYRVLDALEHAAVAERLSPIEAWRGAIAALPDEDPAQLKRWTRRFYQLWAHSQWKRERLALSFHLDDHNVDPRSWCRFPALNSGFEAELKELEGAPHPQ
jgi:NAD+ synthase (glutamine-hydrolysing)